MTFHLPFFRRSAVAVKTSSPLLSADGRRSRFRLPVLGLWAMVLALGLISCLPDGCTPNLAGDNVGWSPLSVAIPQEPGEPVRVYVASEMDGNLGDLGTRLGQDLGADERKVKVRALDDFGSGTPRVAWTYPPLGGGGGLVGAFGSPAVSPELGLVYVSAVDGYVYALSTTTGSDAEGWKRAVRADPSREPQPLISSPVLAQIVRTESGPATMLLVASEDGNLYGYDAATGNELSWSPFATGGKIWSTPAVFNGIAYFGSQDHYVYAVNLRDGSELWRFRAGGAIVADPLLFSGSVIIGSLDKKLYALDADDGELEWEFESGNWFWAGAATDGQTIFAPSMDGNVYALDADAPAPGEVKGALWRHNMESPVAATPVLVPLGLVVAAVDGRMRLLSTSPSNLDNGEVISNLPSLEEGEIKSPLTAIGPAVSQGNVPEPAASPVLQRPSVFVSGDNGVIRRISVAEGQDKESIWCYNTAKHEACR